MKYLSPFTRKITFIEPTLRQSLNQGFSPELEYTISWFEKRIVLLDRHNAELEDSLWWYRFGFWSLVILAAGMVIGAIAEVLG